MDKNRSASAISVSLNSSKIRVSRISNGSAGPIHSTQCQCCGVSYSSISEIKALQARIKGLQLELTELKSIENTNLDLKEELHILTEFQNDEIVKQNKLIQSLLDRQANLESELFSINYQGVKNTSTSDENLKPKNESPDSETKCATGDNIQCPNSSFSVDGIPIQNPIITNEFKNISIRNSEGDNDELKLNPAMVEKEKLKEENKLLTQEIFSFQVKLEELNGNLLERETKYGGVLLKYERLQNNEKYLGDIINHNNDITEKSIEPNEVVNLKKSRTMMLRQLQLQLIEMKRFQQEYEAEIVTARNEALIEKEKADICLVNNLIDNTETEKAWNEVWNNYQESLSDQIESLKTNYDKKLSTAIINRETLQQKVNLWKERNQQSKDAWEKYKLNLSDQIKSWKINYETKHTELENLLQAKGEAERIYKEKSKEVNYFREINKQICEERQALLQNLERVRRKIEKATQRNSISVLEVRHRPSSQSTKLRLPTIENSINANTKPLEADSDLSLRAFKL